MTELLRNKLIKSVDTACCLVVVMTLCMALPSVLAAQSFGISLPPALNFSVSPSPVGSGARAQGKGLAFIAVADDATAASHNPAGLVQLQWPEVSMVGSYFLRFELQDVNQPNTVIDDQSLDGFHLDYFSIVYPFRSKAYPGQRFHFNWVASLNFQRLFDLQGDTYAESRYQTINGIQRVQSRQDGGLFAISPAVAVQVNSLFSVGLAFNIWPDLFDNGWEQDVLVQGEGSVSSGNEILPFQSAGRIRERYGFEGFNVTAGFLWQINRRLPIVSIGGVVRSPFTAKVTRTHSSALTITFANGAQETGGERFRETLDMDMPLSYGLGLSVRMSDALSLSLDVSRIHWSDFRLEASRQPDIVRVENGAPSGKGEAVLNGEADDTTTVRFGVEYVWLRPQVLIPLRAGFFYDPEPGDQGTDDFLGFSFGTGFTTNTLVFDLAYTFRTGTVQNEAADTAIYQHEILASVIYRFEQRSRRP